MTLTYIDSNAWIYFFDATTPEHKSAEKQMRMILGTEDIILNTVTIIEVAHYLSKRLTGPDLRRRMLALTRLTGVDIVGFDAELLDDAIDLLAQYAREGLGGRDATILATMLRHDSNRIVTQDKMLKKVAEDLELTVIDPISG